MQNNVISARNTSLHGSQTSPVVLYMQNNVISFKISILYRSQPSPAIFTFKTTTLGPELLVSIGPSTHLFLLQAKQRHYDQN